MQVSMFAKAAPTTTERRIAMLSKCIARTIAILGIVACAAGTASAQNIVKVGMVMPMTGALAAAGRQVVAGLASI